MNPITSAVRKVVGKNGETNIYLINGINRESNNEINSNVMRLISFKAPRTLHRFVSKGILIMI